MNKKDNVILIGMPGAGKSTIGVILAKIKGMNFIDSDLVIQEKTGKLLKDIIEDEGVNGFIKVENDINSSISVNNCIIATGGSAIYGEEAMTHFKETGTVVYIKLDFDTIDNRLGNIKQRGVLLKEGQNLKSLYTERCPLYEKYADIIVEASGMDIEEVVENIFTKLQNVV